jgi:hypothetical protein
MNQVRYLVALFAGVLLVGVHGAPSAAAVVDVNALSETGVTINLTAGTYEATPISGTFVAWTGKTPVSTTGCDADGKNCQDGWTTRFEVSSASLGAIVFTPPETNFLTAEIALANAITGLFTLAVDEAVTFRVFDNPGDYGDNIGGVSLEVSQVPLPAALPLFLAALAGLGLFGWRRRLATA